MSPRIMIIGGTLAVIGLALGDVLLGWLDGPARDAKLLRIDRVATSDKGTSFVAKQANFIPDDLSQKYAPTRRVEFHITSTQDTSIFVLATGVQTRTSSGWQTSYEEYRGEIWRLTNGMVREVCVERPAAEAWRAYVRYGTEMKGMPLIRGN